MNDNQRAQKEHARELSMKNGEGFGSYNGGDAYSMNKAIDGDSKMSAKPMPGFNEISNKQNQHEKAI